MARLELELPETFLFSIQLTVRASDLNYGAHVGNDQILSLMQEARVRFLRTHGFESEVCIDNAIGIIVSDALLIYKSEAFLGDEIEISLAVADINKYGFDMLYKITNKLTGVEVARGKTGIVCLDYNRRKVVSMPEKMKQIILK